jgi:probable F420-dependent oxidoreductase
MKIGLYGINIGACVEPAAAILVAGAAEDAGFDSVWTAEHVVLPDPQVPPSPAPPELPFLDPAVALAHVAGHTQTLLLATGIIILPQRNPLVLAKELATLDVLSEGRLIFGLGAGYLEPEFEALGIPFADRGPRTDEYTEAILALWTQEKPSYEGRFVSFRGVRAEPRPVQKPHPPLIIGGHSLAACRRAVSRGNGWYGFNLDIEGTKECLARIAQARDEVARPESLRDLEISVTPPPAPPSRDLLREYEDLGVHRLILLPPFGGADPIVDAVRHAADVLL